MRSLSDPGWPIFGVKVSAMQNDGCIFAVRRSGATVKLLGRVTLLGKLTELMWVTLLLLLGRTLRTQQAGDKRCNYDVCNILLGKASFFVSEGKLTFSVLAYI